jgi:autotransporter adhesin
LNAFKHVQTNLNATTGRVKVVEGKVVDLRTNLTEETAARIEGDKRAIAEANSYSDAGDAHTLGQANAYSDAGDARTLGQANAYTDAQIKGLDQKLTKQINSVGAMAMAASVAGSASPAPGDKTAITAALGAYGGEHALAVGVTHIVAPNKRVFGTISRSSRKTGAGLGASFSF